MNVKIFLITRIITIIIKLDRSHPKLTPMRPQWHHYPNGLVFRGGKIATTFTSTQEATLLHCARLTRSLPAFTPSRPPTISLHLKLVLSLLHFCSSLRHRKYVQCISVVFSPRCHGSTVCFRHSDRGYCQAYVMTGFREKQSICWRGDTAGIT